MSEELTPTHRALAAIRDLRRRYDAVKKRIDEPIAIVGTACRFPGGVDSPEAYWELLRSGGDGVGEIPHTRWDVSAYYDPDPAAPGRMYARHGGFLESVAHFDNELFGITDDEATDMDPQQRLLLELSWEALERAGIPPRPAEDSDRLTGVFVGLATHDYSRAHIDSGEPECIGRHAFTGAAFSIASGRIAYLLGLQGPAMTVDTACSSSLVAIHLACQSLRSGECDTAIAGGANVLADPHRFVYFCKTAALSPTGRCRAFDAEADGYVRGEGAGVVVLKRLSDAVAEKDDILAVIRGSGVNHDGQSNGLTAPNGTSQKQLIRHVLKRASVTPRELGYVECHGTGTPLGDPIEVNALGDILAADRTSSQPQCYLGACKTNLGHLEAAAGVAGVLKTAMVLERGAVPPNLHLHTPNPNIDWDALPMKLPQSLEPWPTDAQPRFGSVSAFGFSGTNAHLVLEQPPVGADGAGAGDAHVPPVILLSAASQERLRASASRMRDYLTGVCGEGDHATLVRRLAYTTQCGRTSLSVRLAVVTDSTDELRHALDAFVEGDDHRPGVYTGRLGADSPGWVLPQPASTDDDSPDRLAAHWAAGGRVSWTAVYGPGEKPRMLVLPTYPFARRYFWRSLHGDARPLAGDDESATSGTCAAQSPATNDAADARTRVVRCFARRLDMPVDDVAATAGPGALHIDSIRLVQLRYELEQELGVAISMQQLAGDVTWEELVAVAETSADSGRGRDNANARPAAVAGPQAPAPTEGRQPFPLTELQEAYLLGRELGAPDERVGCHLYLELEVRDLDVRRLNEAWNRLFAHHGMLRAEMLDDGRQRIRDYEPYSIAAYDLTEADAVSLSEHFRRVRRELSHRVYRPGDWPMFTIRVTAYEGGCYRVHVSIDELIVDGASVSRLLGQWQSLYRNPESRLPDTRLTFADHLRQGQQSYDSERMRRDRDYWLSKCGDLPPAPALPAAAQGTAHGHRHRLKAVLVPAQWSAFSDRARALGVSPTVLMLTVFNAVLGRAQPERAFTLVMTLFNRLSGNPDIEQLVGPLASSGLFIAEPERNETLAERCRAVQEQLWNDLDHGSIGGVGVLRELRRRRAVAADTVLPVVFTSMVDNFASTDFDENWCTDWVYAVTQTPQVHLDHQAAVKYGALHVSWDVAVGVVDLSEAQALFRAYHAALALVAEDASAELPQLRRAIDDAMRVPCAPGTPLRDHEAATPPEAPPEPFVLTDLQSAYLFGRVTGGDGTGCVVYQEFELDELDVARLETAWNHLLEDQGMLRAVIGSDGRQMLRSSVPHYRIPVDDLREHDDAGTALAKRRRAMSHRAFAPDEWPMFELRVSRTCGGWVVHIAVDMLIADAPSIYLLYRELFARYHGATGVTSPVDYRAFVEKVYAADADRLGRGDAYWDVRFASLPPGPDLREPAGGKGGRQRHERELADLPRLRRQAGAHSLSLQDVLFAAYMEVLGELAWDEPFTVVVVDFRRPSHPPGLDHCVGDFTWLSWISSTDGQGTFVERVRAFRDQLERDRAHYPVSGLRALRRKVRDASGRALAFPVVFSRLLDHGDVALPSGVRWGQGVSRTPQVCLDNVSVERDGRLHVHWDAVDEAFGPGVVARLLDRYVARLAELADDPSHWHAPQSTQTSVEGLKLQSL